MTITNKWGQGQIFAFSALDGEAHLSDDFTGTLSGDRLGIRFHTRIKRELAIVKYEHLGIACEAALGDFICFSSDAGKIRIIYHDTNLIIGDVCTNAVPVVFVEGCFSEMDIENVRVHDTADGDFTALAVEENRFAFAYAKSAEKAAQLAARALSIDTNAAAEKKLEFYRKHGLSDDSDAAEKECRFSENHIDNRREFCQRYGLSAGALAPLYSKCLSVMKTQLYSPEGGFKHIWSTPDRLPHRYMWFWDSVFHAIGHRHISKTLAQELILSIFDNQADDGFIAHMVKPDSISEFTQPPIAAWGAYKLYEDDGDIEFLKGFFSKYKKYLSWCDKNRTRDGENLYIWKTEDSVICRCGESGMDNSPRFDGVVNLQAIDFSCFMANEQRFMEKIARAIGDRKSAEYFAGRFEAIKAAVNEKLWDEEDGFYFDYDYDRKHIHKVWSVASFLPLFAGICSKAQAKRLVAHLLDPNKFLTKFPIPSIAVSDKTFGSDMWRGPVWINYNYMLAEGLSEFGYGDLSRELKEKTILFMKEWYDKTGTIYEFYDCENERAPGLLNRKGTPFEPYNFNVRYQSIRDYGWSCALLCDMIADI